MCKETNGGKLLIVGEKEILGTHSVDSSHLIFTGWPEGGWRSFDRRLQTGSEHLKEELELKGFDTLVILYFSLGDNWVGSVAKDFDTFW